MSEIFWSKNYADMPEDHQMVARDVTHVFMNHIKFIELMQRQVPPEVKPVVAGAYITAMLRHTIAVMGPDDAERMIAEMIADARKFIAKNAAPAAEVVDKLKRGSLN